MDALKVLNSELSKLRLATIPFAIKLLRSKDEIPKNAKKPVKDFQACLSTCQAFTLTRRHGMTVAQLKEDMWCPMPVMGFGLAETPQMYLEGHNRYPGSTKTLEAGVASAQELPCLPVDEYVGIVSAPLDKVDFEPDVVVLYCNPSQLLKLLHANAYQTGRDLSVKLSGNAACVYCVVPSMLSKECYVSSPCSGDRRRAGAQDDELIFTIPVEKIEEMIEGLQKGSGNLPVLPNMVPEHKLASSYAEICNIMGMTDSMGKRITGSDRNQPYE